MNIGQWFKNLFAGAPRTGDEIDINEARIDAGGGGPLGSTSHDSPGEEAGLAEEESE